MRTIAIIGNSPDTYPDLQIYKDDVNVWIGADRGSIELIRQEMPVDYAIGDFDSTTEEERVIIKGYCTEFEEYPSEKNETDLELALLKAFSLQPQRILLFGVTGGRLDHELVNIQLLYRIVCNNIKGIIIDKNNILELTMPGIHKISLNAYYPTVSFIPYTKIVKGLSLTGFYYPLTKQNITWGSTLCISNKLIGKNGTFSYEEGILLLVKSRDTIQK
ncbi:thiamine diphosphokinase [Virgibacillus sp. SK37]|uniref:thiamine diphosphokinase n=1 Tax=Virgibacillus sp. SK37 TaxID=403957 RepID=UPI0004D0B282|nr:thiamine diphosphokinase [Virgibacillus sp. SK37]AIF43803.1 thiamine pyrophosphokinase [Virgibacillus sp. SK37]